MYKKILVPLDGSELSETVLPHVRALASCTGAEVILLRVVPNTQYETAYAVPFAPNIAPNPDLDVRVQAEGYLQRAAFDNFPTDVNVRYEVCGGPITEAILDYAAGTNADLIVMATHGRTGLSRSMLGSVAEDVVRRSHLPVLVMRPQ